MGSQAPGVVTEHPETANLEAMSLSQTPMLATPPVHQKLHENPCFPGLVHFHCKKTDIRTPFAIPR